MMESNQQKSNREEEIILSYLEKISHSKISKEEIERLVIHNDWYKELLIVAWYEKSNRFKGLPYVKELKVKYQQDLEKLLIIKELMNRLKTKGKFSFNANIYANYLGCCRDNRSINKIKELEISTIPKEIVSLKQSQDNIAVMTPKEVGFKR